ncbi:MULTISPECIES: DUF6105 family protein [unclassified Ensifer]|uniref:DUF6105 family protein n=1 Tax=unclassified Ensifer TaxID=2633371 RepID=UPI0008138CD5|nr:MULTISPECIES: DUF6105 family protein [unclassified Ensifer]OCP01228.1 hypothetical protein BC362_22525 [Ensifer sp. LC14]OCP03120.1 hypothetical protein BBX50_05645 [Ensifer sp. LC11]OCP03490.1 hypothetical protein BC374_05705 [Ensifer sp. LC13]OCP33903.1 hypothetical protein BC364_13195 [Ensifer sp. LC499]
MKWFLILWGGPVLLLTGWYGLSYHDMSFGFFMLTRQTHDLVFQIYGNVLGIPPETIPPLVARAIVVDSLIVFAIIGYRKRRQIAAWYRRRFGAAAPQSERPPLASEASLSSAP